MALGPASEGCFQLTFDEDFLALPGVSADSKRKIMRDNCLRLYGFSGDALVVGS
jgi:hypothetical protein